jgi:hypothetical protein
MRLPTAVVVRLPHAILCLACAALFAGCTTSPVSGRAQFNILPGTLETAVPDLRFDVKTLLATGGDFCREGEDACPAREAADALARRIAPIAERLGSKAAELSPELATRVPHVVVFVVPGDSPKVSSSAGGKIAVGAGLARLELRDEELALALAREFGRLAAAHHRESASAGLAVSLIAGSPLTSAYLATTVLADILFPMGALAKLGISLLASMGTEQLVEATQQEEADAFAARLMLAAGYDLQTLAEPRPEMQPGALQLGWLQSYYASRTRVAAMAPGLLAAAVPDPWPDEAPVAAAAPAASEPWPDETPAVQLAAAATFEPWPDEAPPSLPLATRAAPEADIAQVAEPASDETVGARLVTYQPGADATTPARHPPPGSAAKTLVAKKAPVKKPAPVKKSPVKKTRKKAPLKKAPRG